MIVACNAIFISVIDYFVIGAHCLFLINSPIDFDTYILKGSILPFE